MNNSLLISLWDFFCANSLVMSFLVVAVIMALSSAASRRIARGRIQPSAVAILAALALAWVAGRITGGSGGLSDIAVFSGIGILGGSMFRDFSIIATAYGADLNQLKQCRISGVLSLFFGIATSFAVGAALAYSFGYRDAESIAVIGAGTVTFTVGPVTAAALGVNSEVVAVSIAAGVIKSICIMAGTPFAAKKIGLSTPKAAMIYGAFLGSTSGISAGLAATDPKLVPYGAMTSTFYMGLGCLLCPTVLYWAVEALL